MNNEPVVWKAYDEVNFSDQYILRWVRESDEYVNRISKEMMEDFKSVLRQQQAEIEALKKRIERMLEKQSHYEAMAHAGGFEAGRAKKVAKQIDIDEYITPED